MTKVGKASCFVGLCGICLIFGGPQELFLAWAGLATVLASASVYTIDKYLCSSADMILDIDIPVEDPTHLPGSLGNVSAPIEVPTDNKVGHPNVVEAAVDIPDGAYPPPLTYRYDAISGQWDATTGQMVSEDKARGLKRA